MKSAKFAALILMLSLSNGLWAGPAAWYKWHSPLGDFDICSQTSPGEGWFIVNGPFEDAVCKKKGVPR